MDTTTCITLNNGTIIPMIGLGTWQCQKEECQSAIRAALDMGYRHFDTAFRYDNEADIREVLQEYIVSNKVKREDLYIVTKLPMNHMDPINVERSLDISLNRLRLSYVDLYLIHTPCSLKLISDDDTVPVTPDNKYMIAGNTDILPTWRIECNAYFPQDKLQSLCQRWDIVLTAYSPFGSPGKLDRPKEYHRPDLLQDPLVYEISKKIGKTPAQVLLRFLLQKNFAIIPKSSNVQRIQENINIFKFELAAEDMEKISNIKHYERDFTMKRGRGHPEYPFHIPF